MAFPNWDMQQHGFRTFGMAVLILLGLYALAPTRAEAPQVQPLAMRLVPLPDAEGRLPELSRDGSALRLGVSEDTRRARVELRFVLPPRTTESQHWVIWMRRVPVDALALRVADVWRGEPHSFLAPEIFEGPMPVGYIFRLPSSWEGEIRIEMTASAMRTTTLQPEVISEELADRYVQEATIFMSLSYASLMTLALMTLALFFASRDASFLSFFVFCVTGVALLAFFNGHIYLLDSFGLLRPLGGAGLHAMALLFELVPSVSCCVTPMSGRPGRDSRRLSTAFARYWCLPWVCSWHGGNGWTRWPPGPCRQHGWQAAPWRCTCWPTLGADACRCRAPCCARCW
jgi:hypothetical protein